MRPLLKTNDVRFEKLPSDRLTARFRLNRESGHSQCRSGSSVGGQNRK